MIEEEEATHSLITDHWLEIPYLLPSLSHHHHHGGLGLGLLNRFPPHRKFNTTTTTTTRVKFSLNEIPPIHSLDSSIDFQGLITRTESFLYTLADAAVVAVDSADATTTTTTTTTDAAIQKSGGWFGFISDAMEAVLKVDYLIHVHEIKPWPPSQSLKSVRSVLLQWENGDGRNSGTFDPVIPSLGSAGTVGDDDGKIEFNESFRLPLA